MTTNISQDQYAFYREHGYLSFNHIISDQDLQELRAITDRFVEQSRSVTEHTDLFDLEPGHTQEIPLLRRLKSPINHHDIYRRVMKNDHMLDIVASLIGDAIRCNGNKLNMKLPNIGSAVEWHQDWAFYPHTNDDLLAVGVALDDIDETNGPLLVVPGSHKGPIYDHHIEGHFCGAITESELSTDDAVPIYLDAGGISVHHVRLVHGSAPNRSNQPRRLMLYQFVAGDAWPLMGVPDYDEYNSLLVRGEESNIPRVRDVPVRMPFPPALKSGSIYESQTVLPMSAFEK